ncbi:LptF/LptG family permease [Aquirufa rosea]|uniref:YjgP/YjgQ family permease n=1 Tax=Aquirufa rosea TaxID=2509241 RepID=A0A4Q1C2W0_9BACT|nr:LptF/LptG family permease [Aquirufa rosea]RXK52411.1 YjgP/YjgQ family permease [Aquirufa rosea]
MRKIDKLVLNAFWGPFVLTFLIVIFIFLLRLVLFYFADLFGKDLGASIYLELFFYFSLITVPLAMPLSILLSSLMTFGKLGENFELTALKSAGISIYRIFRPIFVCTIIISIFMFWFVNVALPWANLKGWSLLYDIKTTKTTLNIKEGIFYNDLPGYSIKVAKKYPDNKTLKSLIIYDHTGNDGNRHVTLADSAQMYTILDRKYLIFVLFNGIDYIEDADRGPGMDLSELAIHRFKKSKIVMSLAGFDLQKTEENQFAHHQIMRNNNQLAEDADSLSRNIRNMRKGFSLAASVYYVYFRKPVGASLRSMNHNTAWIEAKLAEKLKNNRDFRTMEELAKQEVQNLISFGQTNEVNLAERVTELKKTDLEWHHKFTNSLAVLVMFLIGAPLGAIIKKGGFGIPVVVAVSFFILMYIMTQQGDKMAKEGKVLVEVGAWISNTILALIGAYFLKIALQDSRLFESDLYKVWWDKIKTRWALRKQKSSRPV